jgi:hypothetical protein
MMKILKDEAGVVSLPNKKQVTEGLVDIVLLIGAANTAYATYANIIPLTYAATIIAGLGIATRAVPLIESVITWLNTQTTFAVTQAQAQALYIEQVQKEQEEAEKNAVKP